MVIFMKTKLSAFDFYFTDDFEFVNNNIKYLIEWSAYYIKDNQIEWWREIIVERIYICRFPK